MNIAYFHLPGLFEFFELYRLFLPLFRNHKEYFYEWCDIGSIYGAPEDCLWGGGRIGEGNQDPREVACFMSKYGISSRLTFSNSLLKENHLADKKCNELCRIFSSSDVSNGVIVHSDLLAKFLRFNFQQLYLVSSTTKVLTNFKDLVIELNRKDFDYVVPDFRLNKSVDDFDKLSEIQKNKIELLCNECCWIGCTDRKLCYENVSRRNLRETCIEFECRAPDSKSGYMFSKAMKNPSFIGLQDILEVYLPLGISNFKIEGRSLGSALVLEFILYYMVKPEFQLQVREKIYLDNTLDLF